MTKDEALDLALEALEKHGVAPKDWACKECVPFSDILKEGFQCRSHEAITAIKQARALDKKAENAKELGLDYEPADGTQVSKVWWDGEKLMAKPIPLEDLYQPVQDSTCNETLRAQGKAYPRTCRKCGLGPCIGAPKQLPAAQRQWVGLTHEEKRQIFEREDYQGWLDYINAIEAKLKERNV